MDGLLRAISGLFVGALLVLAFWLFVSWLDRCEQEARKQKEEN